MDPLLTLSAPRVPVDPGGEVRLQVGVRNPGELVEQYRFSVLGEAAAWTQVVPRDVSVLPGRTEDQVVQVVFRPPPAPAAPAGEVPFGVLCTSLEHADTAAVVEGDVVVSAVEDLEVTVGPYGSDGRRRGRFRVDLRNTGTAPLAVAVSAKDDAGLLRLALAPARVEVPPRGAAGAYLGLRPRTPRWLGKPVQHTVTVAHELSGADRPRQGQDVVTWTQRARIPRWLVVVAALLLVALVAVLAWVVLRPGAEPGPALTAGRPPAVAIVSADAVTGDTARITWQHSPYASTYQVQQLRDGVPGATTDVQAPSLSVDVPGLAAGQVCFAVVPISAAGRGPTSEQLCAEMTGLATSPSESPGGAPTDGAPTDGAPTDAPVPPATGPATGATDQPYEPEGFYVMYYRVPLDDRALEDRAFAVQSALQQQGVAARLVDSRTSAALPDGAAGFWFVVADGFPDAASAAAECAARTGTVPDVTSCTFGEP